MTSINNRQRIERVKELMRELEMDDSDELLVRQMTIAYTTGSIDAQEKVIKMFKE